MSGGARAEMKPAGTLAFTWREMEVFSRGMTRSGLYLSRFILAAGQHGGNMGWESKVLF